MKTLTSGGFHKEKFMSKLFSILFIFSLTAQADAKKFGKDFTVEGKPLSLTEAMNKISENQGKDILIKAEISQVCQSKGCWMKIKEGKNEVRVTFTDYAFFVPKDAAKRTIVAQGKLFDKEISAAEARHYARDAKASEEEVKAIKTGRKEPWFEATGLVLE